MKQSIITAFLGKTQDRFSEYQESTELRQRLEMVKRIDGVSGIEIVFPYETGDPEETKDRKCLCNGLLANLDLAQQQKNNYTEKVFVTAGDDIKSISRILKNGSFSYSAIDVIDYLLNGLSM